MEFIDKIKALDQFKDLTEDAIVAKVKSISNEAAKVDALNAKIEALEAENKANKDASKDAFLDKAISEGRITAAQKETYRKLMDADEASTKDLINSLQPAAGPSIKDYLKGGAAHNGEAKDLAQMSWEEIDKAERLGELKDKFPELYKAKYKEAFGVSL